MLFLFMVFFTLADVAEAADNSIKPEQTNVFSTEGSNISLSCTYTGSVNSLLWYRHKPGSRPDFLLMIDESSKHVTPAQPPHPRLSIKLENDQDKKSKKVDLIISSAAVSDSALYYCALQPDSGGRKLYFGSGIKLAVEKKEKKEPEYYKVKPKNTTDQESCLATRFTVHNVTEETWPLSGVHKAGAVLFDGEGYYSRLMLNDVNNCNETESTCGIKTEDSITFQSDAKTNFLALTIFWLRVLFFKTIAFNILMTVKVWLN